MVVLAGVLEGLQVVALVAVVAVLVVVVQVVADLVGRMGSNNLVDDNTPSTELCSQADHL